MTDLQSTFSIKVAGRNGVLRIITGFGAAFLLAAVSSPAQAVTVMGPSGSYEANEQFGFSQYEWDHLGLNCVIDLCYSKPGKYRFEVETSTPVEFLHGRVLNLFHIHWMSRIDGEWVDTGGGEDLDPHALSQTAPNELSAILRVRGERTVKQSPGEALWMEDVCCGIEFSFLPDSAGTFSVSATAVPEPSTWAMLLLGFGFVGGGMRSAKRRQRLAVSYA